MTFPEVGLTALLALGIVVGWIRHSLEKVLWRRVLEIYLWLVPVSLAWLAAIHDVGGLRVTAAVGALHLLLIAVAVWVLGRRGAVGVSGPLPAVAGFLLIFGSAVVWLGAIAFAGMELQKIHARGADHLFTTGLFLLGGAITLAGFTVLTVLLRNSGNPVLAELGLVAFLLGFAFWAIHLAFRAVVMVSAAREMIAAGTAPSWYASWRPWSGLMYGLYMTMAYLSTAAYGGAMRRTGWAGRGWGRAFVVFGLVATGGFLAFRLFDLPLIQQFMPFVMGIILLRRTVRDSPLPKP